MTLADCQTLVVRVARVKGTRKRGEAGKKGGDKDRRERNEKEYEKAVCERKRGKWNGEGRRKNERQREKERSNRG